MESDEAASNAQKKLPDVLIRMCIPLSSSLQFDPEWIKNRFASQWKIKVACGQVDFPGKFDHEHETFIMGNGKNNMVLNLVHGPMPDWLSDVAAYQAALIDGSEASLLRGNKAHLLVDYHFGSEPPVEQVRFSARTLLTVMELNGSIGYLNFPAQLYRPKSWVQSYFERNALERLDNYVLYLLFTCYQIVTNDDYWLHTHGMEQFGLPDMEVRFKHKDQEGFYKELLGDAALHNMEEASKLNPGDTFERRGDGLIYRIAESKPDPQHPFGKFGAIEFERFGTGK